VSVARGRNSGTIDTGETMTVAVNGDIRERRVEAGRPLALKEQAKVLSSSSRTRRAAGRGGRRPDGLEGGSRAHRLHFRRPEDVAGALTTSILRPRMIFRRYGFFFALFSLRDRHHQRAKEAFRRFEGQNLADVLVHTDQVVSKPSRWARMPRVAQLAVFMGERLYSGKIARIHSTTLEEHRAAFDYFRRLSDKSYSAFDCLKLRGHGEAWHPRGPGDRRGLTHRFVAIPGPLPRAGR